jgi:ATP-dependent helicase/nuclease subunit B
MIERVTIPRAELFEALEAGALVLTGNARLSRSLRAEFDRAMLAAGREAWASPEILPWTAWLKQAWEVAGLQSDSALPRLLDDSQEAALWASVLGEDADTLLRPSATARVVARSWALLHDYGLDLDEPAFGFGEDSQAFRGWARRFAAACSEKNCISPALLNSELCGLIAAGALAVPEQVLLLGFYELTPAQLQLLESLAAAGSQLRWVTLAGSRVEPVRVQAAEPLQEMQLASRWVRKVLDENPAARVGIVVPDLSSARAPLARFLGDALDPSALQPGTSGRARPFNFSLGEPLSGYPVIETALHLLSLAQKELSLEAAGTLLTSPWWAMPDEAGDHAAELARRALLDARLREQHGVPSISPRNLAFHAGQADDDGTPKPWGVPRVARVLRKLGELREGLPARAGAAAWAHQFSGWLQAAGWCRGSRLDSTAYQAVQKWQELLTTLSGLDDFEAPMRLEGALSTVRRLASETVFQPQAPEAQVPVHVLGLLEANEQHFDALWVLGLHDGCWPKPPSPDPFLPLSLQRDRGLPGCDPARELQRARQITKHLAGAGASVVFSYPAAEGAEPLRPSPLIRSFAERSVEELTGEPLACLRKGVQASAQLAAMPPQAPIPFPGGRAKGGTQVIRHQSACPFRAFAEHRLGARPLERAQLGLDAAERGSLMHKVLEIFWRQTGNSAALNGLSENDLRTQVEAAVAAAIAERSRQLEWQPMLSGIERARLARQVLAWLALEQERTPFEILGLEHKTTLSFGTLDIDTKIDRIDVLEDGRVVIIDYKTGKVTPSGWFGERPDDPQLPVYTRVDLPQSVAGVAFGVVKADELKFAGVVADAGVLPGLPAKGKSEASVASENWPAILGEWSQVCQALADDFSAGHATVDPKKGLPTCKNSHCSLQPLCRIHTAEGAVGAELALEDEA